MRRSCLMLLSFFSLLPLLLGGGMSCADIDVEHELSRIEELVSLGKLSDALSRYRGLEKQLPAELSSGSIFFRHAELAAILHLDDEALRLYGRVAALGPLSEGARIARERRADLFERRGRFEEAIAAYTELSKYYPDGEQQPWYRLKIAESFLMAGDPRQARIELTALQRMPKLAAVIHEQILFDLAESHFVDGERAKALVAYELLLRKFPKTPYRGESYLKMSRCFEQLGFLGDAYRLAKAAEAIYPSPAVVEARLKELEAEGTLMQRNEGKRSLQGGPSQLGTKKSLKR